MHLRKKIVRIKKIKKINIFIVVLVLLSLFIYMAFKYINKRVSPKLLTYAEVEINRLASVIISNAINSEINEKIDVEKIFIIEKDNNGKIQTIDYDSRVVNRILIATGTSVQTNLRYLSEGKIENIVSNSSIEDLYNKYGKSKVNRGVLYEIPMGVAFNNPFLANLGPRIPVSFKLVGDMTTNLNTKITNFGINSAMVETSLCLKVKLVIVLPITSKETKIEYIFPVAVKIIQGDIPEYYLNGYNQNSQILTLPVE